MEYYAQAATDFLRQTERPSHESNDPRPQNTFPHAETIQTLDVPDFGPRARPRTRPVPDDQPGHHEADIFSPSIPARGFLWLSKRAELGTCSQPLPASHSTPVIPVFSTDLVHGAFRA